MDAVCTRCAQRYGAHSGVSCPSTAPSNPSTPQVWLKRVNHTSDPSWFLGRVTESLGNKFVKIDVFSPSAPTTTGYLELKDQLPGSTAFVFKDPSGSVDSPSADVRCR